MEVKLLSCPLCFKPHFENVDSLRSTLVSVATSPLTCPVCCEVFVGLDKLTIHLFSHVNTLEKPEESHETAQKEIDESINSICNGTTASNEQETKEDPAHDSAETKDTEVIVCDICSFTFTDQNILDMHQKLLHQTTPDKKTGLYSYHCHLCSKKFRMRGSLMVHLRVAHYGFGHHNNDATRSVLPPEQNTDNPEEKNTEEVKVVAKEQVQGKGGDNKQWECDVCSKMFTTKYFLKKHKRLHTGEMPYCCTLCNKSFTFQQSYHKHMLYHSAEKPYVCNECGRAFKELSTLQNHARIHSGERPYGCETCGKCFRQRVSYLVHRRIHTGDMPYKCTACDKCFRYKVSQKSHKCPMNPPGSVIKVPEQSPKSPKDNNATSKTPSQSPSAVKCIMSVDYNTGNINFIPPNDQHDQKLDMEIHNDIELSNSTPITSQSTVDLSELKLKENFDVVSKKGGIIQREPELDQGNDIFSMVLSPILPEVETLCLNSNSPLNNGPISPNLDENVPLLRDQCFENLLYGSMSNLRR